MFSKTRQLSRFQKFKNVQFCIVSHELHIGRLIWLVAEEKNVNKAKLAQAIGRSRGALYNMFENPSMDTIMLMKLCKELNHNFFADVAKVVDEFVLDKEGKRAPSKKPETEIDKALKGVSEEELTRAFAQFLESKFPNDFQKFLRSIRNENDKNVSSDENEDDLSST